MNFKLLLILFLVIILNCSSNNGKEIFEIKILQDYGDEKENVISHVSDFDFYNSNVYILDAVQMKILIFGLDGNYLSSIGLKSGGGPAEFSKRGLTSFKVFNDSTLAVLDQISRKITIITINNKYLSEIRIDFMPHKLFFKDSLLYISGNSREKLMWVYNLEGELVDTLITPFKIKDIPIYWVSEVTMDKEGAFYITNPYKTEIIKWHNEILWKFSDEKLDLVKTPESKKRGKGVAINQTRGWTTNGIFTFGNYLITSTFSHDTIKGKKLLPHILVLDKNNGKLFFMKEREQPFRAKSFQNGRFVFMSVYEPFPQLKRIELKIIRE